MRLGNNFIMEEFTRSDIARIQGIRNEPDAEHTENIRRLVTGLLQPLRDKYGKALHINSGYRSPALNSAAGGVPTSQHTKGEAADVRADDPRELLAVLLSSGLDFDQAILYPTFLHLSYRNGNNRKQVLYAKGATP